MVSTHTSSKGILWELGGEDIYINTYKYKSTNNNNNTTTNNTNNTTTTNTNTTTNTKFKTLDYVIIDLPIEHKYNNHHNNHHNIYQTRLPLVFKLFNFIKNILYT